MGRDIGHVQGDAGRPQVPLSLSPVFLCCMHRCCRLRPLHGHRGRGVEKLTKNMTFEKMAARMSTASSSTQGLRGRSSVGHMTKQSRCGTCQTANASRLSPDIGEPPLRSVACAPRSPGERRRRELQMCSLTLQENGRGVDDHYIM